MGARTAAPSAADQAAAEALGQSGPTQGVTPREDQAQALKEHALGVLQDAEVSLREFKSGNTGLYVTKGIKASDARAKGLFVPPGGKVKVQVTVIVVDPENSDN